MPIYTEGPIIRRGQTLEEFETPFGDYISEKFNQAIDSNPMALINETARFNRANEGDITAIDPLSGDAVPAFDPFTGMSSNGFKNATPPRLSAEEINARAKEAGVKVDVPENGLSAEALDIMIKRREREKVQQDAIARSPTGARSWAGFGVQLGASILDPLNIGLAFVPVVGPARYSAMIAKAGSAGGRAGVRAGVGAAEGAAGVALFEPFNFGLHAGLQDDYSALDSLMNIGFGSVLGGGLHVGAGGIKDAYLGDWWKPTMPPAVVDLPGTIYGGNTQIKIGDAYEPARWAVVDAAEQAVTINKADNQFRDRSRVASDDQIRDIANKIDFNLLNNSPVMDSGAPTMTADGRIVGGNGRMAAIGRAYDIGSGPRYQDPLMGALERYGIDPASIEGMKKPALVRVLQNDVDVRRAAILSNEGMALRMSALEQSKVDAERLGNFRGFDVNDTGEVNTAGNRAFIRSWVNEQPVNQRAALMDADGLLSVEGKQRLSNAILYKAYGDSPTLGRLIEATDPGSKNVASALVRSAGRVADAQEAIKTGDLHAVDIADDVRAAVEKLDALKQNNTTVAEFMAQGDLLGSGMTPDAIKIMRFISENIRSPRAISDMINKFYEGLTAAGNPKQADIFGAGAPSKTALLDRALVEEAGNPSAAAVAERATPEQREAALRNAVGQAMDGRQVEIEPVFKPDADTASAVARQADPASVRVADVDAARAADERLAVAPKSEALADAEAELARVMKDLEERVGVVSDSSPTVKAETGPVLYHGTSRGTNFDRYDYSKANSGVGSNAFDQGDYFYLSGSKRAADFFAGRAEEVAQLRAGKIADDVAGDVLEFSLKPGAKVLPVDNMPRGKAEAKVVLDEAKANGYDAVSFPDRGFATVEGSKAVADLIKKEGLPTSYIVLNEGAVSRRKPESRNPSASAKNPVLAELKVYDDAIKASEELGLAARAAAVCDLRR